MTPNTPAGGAVACPECGAPCETGVRYKDMSFRELVTDYMYSPPATVPADAVLKVREAIFFGGEVWDGLKRSKATDPVDAYMLGRQHALDELEALTRGEK